FTASQRKWGSWKKKEASPGLGVRARSSATRETTPAAGSTRGSDSEASGASGAKPERVVGVSEALIRRLAAQPEQLARVAEILGMAHEQRAAGRHQSVDALEHGALRRRVEVDHHVAAEDHVEGLA